MIDKNRAMQERYAEYEDYLRNKYLNWEYIHRSGPTEDRSRAFVDSVRDALADTDFMVLDGYYLSEVHCWVCFNHVYLPIEHSHDRHGIGSINDFVHDARFLVGIIG